MLSAAETYGLAEPSSYVDAKSETKLELEWVKRVSNTACLVRGTPDEETGEVNLYRVTRRCDARGNWAWSCECECGQMRKHVTCSHKLAAAKAYDDPSLFALDALDEGLAEFERELAELEASNV